MLYIHYIATDIGPCQDSTTLENTFNLFTENCDTKVTISLVELFTGRASIIFSLILLESILLIKKKGSIHFILYIMLLLLFLPSFIDDANWDANIYMSSIFFIIINLNNKIDD